MRTYYARLMADLPDLRFELTGVHPTKEGLSVRCNQRGQTATEDMKLDADGRISRAWVSYR